MSDYMLTTRNLNGDIRDVKFAGDRPAMTAELEAQALGMETRLYYQGCLIRLWRFDYLGWRCALLAGHEVLVIGTGQHKLTALRQAVLTMNLNAYFRMAEEVKPPSSLLESALLAERLASESELADAQRLPPLEHALDIRAALEGRFVP